MDSTIQRNFPMVLILRPLKQDPNLLQNYPASFRIHFWPQNDSKDPRANHMGPEKQRKIFKLLLFRLKQKQRQKKETKLLD